MKNNIINAMNSAMKGLRHASYTIRAKCKYTTERATEILRSDSGASHFIEMLIGILIVVVIGALFVEQTRTMITDFFTFLWGKIQSVFTV